MDKLIEICTAIVTVSVTILIVAANAFLIKKFFTKEKI